MRVSKQKNIYNKFKEICPPIHSFPHHLRSEISKSMFLADEFLDKMNMNSTVENLLKWMDMSRKKLRLVRQEPYALFFRLVFLVKKNGKGVGFSDLKRFNKIMPYAEKIVEEIDKRGNLFAKTVFHETLAHRFANYYILSGNHEKEMVFHYDSAHQFAKEFKLYKNIDSSYFWLGKAYEKSGDIAKACHYYCLVANRKGKRCRVSPQEFKRIRFCKKKCKELSFQNIIS